MATRYDDTHEEVAVTGAGWAQYSSGNYYGGSYQYTQGVGEYFEVPFNGTGIGWVGTKSSTQGSGAVYIDNELQGTASLYSGTVQYQVTIWSIADLSDGNHTLKVVRATKYINIDAFDIEGTIGHKAGSIPIAMHHYRQRRA